MFIFMPFTSLENWMFPGDTEIASLVTENCRMLVNKTEWNCLYLCD
jgi:hypothetical protein